jgi:hypothetical protein
VLTQFPQTRFNLTGGEDVRPRHFAGTKIRDLSFLICIMFDMANELENKPFLPETGGMDKKAKDHT